MAIKILRLTSSPPSVLQSIRTELKFLGNLRHPRVVGAIAVCLDLQADEGIGAIVLPYMNGGNLYSILHDSSLAESKPNTIGKKIRIAQDIALGLSFLHQSGNAYIAHHFK